MVISNYLPKTAAGRPNTLVIGLVLFILAIWLRMIFLWLSLANLPVTSDEASSVLLAKMISRGELPLLFLGQPYQFPVESYLMAPFVEWMPRTPFGARYQLIISGLAAFWGFFSIVRNGFPSGSRWPAILLICFPSAYFLIFLAAYAPPQYSISVTLAWVSIYGVVRSRTSSRSILFLMLSGLSCGLAVSNHLLTVTISAGVFALVLWSGSFRKSLKGVIVFSLCFLVGALPYILAIWLIPGAYKNLPGSLSFVDTLSRLIFPALSQTLPGAMGVNPILFPDLVGHVDWPSALRSIFAIFYSLLLLSLIVQRAKVFFTSVIRKTWPQLDLVDLAIITSLLTLWVFASHQTLTNAYRYVLPAVWCFPFLIGHAYSSFTGRFRSFVGAAAVCLALFNIAVTIQVMAKWSNAEQLERYALSPGIEELIETLKERDITHCYASFWLAYRITFETDEKIICSLPYNQRFPLWPIPYRQQVDDKPHSAYVLTQHYRPRLPVAAFDRHLKSYGITAQRTEVGPFFIYQDFSYPSYVPGAEKVLSTEHYTLSTNSGGEEALPALQDRDFATSWIAGGTQEKGQSVMLQFDSPQVVNSMTIFHLPGNSKSPTSFKIYGNKPGDETDNWQPIAGPIKPKTERLRFVNNHPVYSGISQQIRFDSTEVEALRLEIVEPNKKKRWGMMELEVSVLSEDQ